MSKKILLSKGYSATVDDEDYEWLMQWNWHYANRYAKRSAKNINGKYVQIKMHNDIMKPPEGMYVDHINRNSLDNRKANLRICTLSQNNANRIITKCERKYKGVRQNNSGTFRVTIGSRENKKGLGSFKNEIAAANCYNYYAKIIYGEFAALNDVEFMDNWKDFRVKFTSMYHGVWWNKQTKRWTARLRNKQVGSYKDEIDAAIAYDNYALEVYGVTYKKFNFPDKIKERIFVNVLPVIYPAGALSDDDKLQSVLSDKNWIAERKFDGVRFLSRKEFDSKVHFTSRQKSKKTGLPVEKQDNFPHLVSLIHLLPNATVLDGEIITSITCTSNDVTKITGAKPEKAIERQKESGFVKYVVYDILYFNGESLLNKKWSDRRLKLEYVIEKYIGLENKYIILSTYVECHKHNVDEWFGEIVAHGGEGLVLKNKNAYYVPGKKPSDTWLKMKKHDTYDVVITGYKDPEMIYTGKETENPFGHWSFWMDKDTGQKYDMPSFRMCDAPKNWIPVTRFYFYNMIGAVKFSQYKDGRLTEIGEMSGLTDEMRKHFSDHKEEMIGKVCECGAMMRMEGTGALRHPHFVRLREDKSPFECVWNEY